jgi:glycosyltransferase involved in cell wall biosynthesis
VLTSNYGLDGKTKIDVHVHRLLHRAQDSSSLLTLARWELADNRTLRDLVQKWKPDVIYSWCLLQLFPSLYATLQESKIPIVFNIQDLWLPTHLAEGERQRDAWLRPGSSISKSLAKKIIRSTLNRRNPAWLRPVTLNDIKLNHVIFCSQFQKRQHLDRELPLGDSRVIYNGVDLKVFAGAPSSNGNGHLKVLFVGRLVEEKGAHTAIDAIARLLRSGYRGVTLSIAGVPTYPWDYSANLKRIVEENRLQEAVQFLGSVPNQVLPDVYRQHDILVFPSKHNEGLPMTLLEAMACGLAVVGATTGGSIEMLDDRVNSLTFPPDDPIALKDCLTHLLENPELRRSLASAGQAMARDKFDLETITDQTLEYLHEIAVG